MSERPRIRDVAAVAGTSVSTVSNLLNGRAHRMSAETIVRIQNAIEQLEYRPSWAARQLKTGFVPVLALLVPSVANPFHGAVAQAVEETAMARGFQVLLGNSLRDPAREKRYAEEVWSFGIRGLIVGSSTLNLEHFADLIRRGLSVVAFDRRVTGGEADEDMIDSVTVDNRRAAYAATRHLIDLGHRRIGYISGATQTVSRRDRLAGYLAAMSDAGLGEGNALVAGEQPAPAQPGYDDTHAAEHGRAAARRLLQDRRPTALVALNDMHAIGACAAVRDLGMTVPGDVSVVGIDDIVLAGVVDPPLTTVRQPLDAMSAAAVDRLVARMSGDAGPEALHQTFEPDLVVRSSTCAPKERR